VKAKPLARKEYVLKQGTDLSGNNAPRYAGRNLTITATVDSKGADGVILAQGGDKEGYALYIRDGKPVLGVRRDWKLTEAVAEHELPAGLVKVTATISKKGNMSISVNGKPVASADAKCVLTKAGDGLQVGDDQIKPVGKYTTTIFAGTISSLKLKFD